MGTPYTSVTVNNYNANPPSDDGAQTPENRVNWSTIKSKLADTLKTAVDAIDDNVAAAFANMVGAGSVISTAITYDVVESNQGDLIRATVAGVTITTPDATDVGSPFSFGLLNSSTGNITLEGNGSQTVNGSASLTVPSGDGYMIFTDGTNWFVIGRKTGVLPRGYIDGCVLSNGTDATNDINIAAGVCRDSTNTVDITVAAMLGKQLDANWAPGAAAGMRNSAIGIANTTYHIWAVAKADGTQDIYAHTSATAATVLTALQAESGGANYVYLRHIMSLVRLSGAIRGFTQIGDEVIWGTVASDFSNLPADATYILRALTVPVGIKVRANVTGYYHPISSNTAFVRIVSPDVADSGDAASATNFTAAAQQAIGQQTANFQILVQTNTSGQVGTRVSAATGSDLLRINTVGFIHPRGRDAA
jgi:hypothetical protein